MKNGIRLRLRQAGAASTTDAVLQVIKALGVLYQVGFAVYLPFTKYSLLPSSIRYRWFVIYILAVLYVQIVPYLPKNARRRWDHLEEARLRAMSIAVARITGSTRESRFSDVEFIGIVAGLLTAIRQEVEAITFDSDGTLINATLLTEDPSNQKNLRVICRANADRKYPSYEKSSLNAWKAMESRSTEYVPNFVLKGKPYKCILALPLVIETDAGDDISIGVVSVDSGQAHDFDGVLDRIELRLLPYLGLLKLALSMKKPRGGRLR